jgi:hypothetical protein
LLSSSYITSIAGACLEHEQRQDQCRVCGAYHRISSPFRRIHLTSSRQAALGSWLDSESSYRLTVEKAKEATEGSEYARNQYEKFHTAYLDAKRTLDEINKQNAEERKGLLDERDLIKEIMRMIGKMRFRL